MRRSRWLTPVIVAAVLLGLLLWILPRSQPRAKAGASARAPEARTPLPIAPGIEFPDASSSLSGQSRVADDLNLSAGTIQRDLRILNEVFETWQSNFPRSGNPVGENGEITRALTGSNELKFAFIVPGHRAIDARGQLCDRWGTPFRFHQLSGQQMEILSAGPDRTFNTPDDAAFLPEISVLR